MTYNLNTNYANFSGVYPTSIFQNIEVAFWDHFPLEIFTGSTFNSPIVHLDKLKGAHGGQSFRIPKFYGGDHRNVRKGFEKRVAYAQKMASSFDEIQYEYTSHVIEYEHIKWLSDIQPLLGTIPEYAKADMARMEALHTQDMVFNALARLYPLNVAGQMPQTVRANAGTGTWVYHANRTLAEQVEAVIPIANRNDHKPSVKNLRRLYKRLRTSGVEDKIRPASVRMVNGLFAYEYHYLMSRAEYLALSEDDEYQKIGPQRGAILPYQPNAIEGADYKGKVEGFNLWVVDALDDYLFQAGGDGINTAWGFALGGGALGLGFHELDRMTQDVIYGDDQVIIASHMVKGAKALTYPMQAAIKDPEFNPAHFPNSRIEAGIVHNFTRVTA